jgi:aminotransferase
MTTETGAFEDRRSQRVGHLAQSDIRRMSRECERLGGVNLGQGICDLPTPTPVKEAACEAIQQDKSLYSPFEGVRELREAVADKLKHDNGLEIDPDHEMVTTVGTTGGFASAVQGLFDPGDELVLFEPYYGYHVNAANVGGLTTQLVTLEPPDWKFDREMLEAVVGPDTRGLVVNTPANPSGKVFDRRELEVVADVARTHDLIVITDEIYEYFLYDDAEHISLATLPGMWERTVSLFGFSKTFAITGWRLGYAVGHPSLIEPVGLVNDVHYVCAPTPLQYGVARAMRQLSDDYYSEMAAEFEQRRDFICNALNDAGLTPYVPEGSYYVLADVSDLGCETSRQASMQLLEQHGVATVPGSAFYDGEAGQSLVRVCYAMEWSVLEEAADRLTG